MTDYEIFREKCPQMRYRLLDANDKQKHALDLSGLNIHNIIQYYRQIVGEISAEDMKIIINTFKKEEI